MCGRYTYFFTWKQLHRLLGGWSPLERLEALRPRYNVAPMQTAPVVRAVVHALPSVDAAHGASREVAFLRWGLVPAWADDPAGGASLINARSETAAAKPAFRDAIRQRRCVVPASGFYEWQRSGDGSKQPCFIARKDRGPIFFAGLWESWTRAGQPPLESFAILTTTANELMAPIHDRMPVILTEEEAERWLDPRVTDPSVVADLLRPAPPDDFEAVAVSSRVNRVANDEPSLITPVERDSGLFG